MAGKNGQLKTLVIVFINLLELTVITVAVAQFHFGSTAINILVAMVIATIKVALVGTYFMHLKWEKMLIVTWALLSIPFFAVMIGLTLWDINEKEIAGKYDDLKSTFEKAKEEMPKKESTQQEPKVEDGEAD